MAISRAPFWLNLPAHDLGTKAPNCGNQALMPKDPLKRERLFCQRWMLGRRQVGRNADKHGLPEGDCGADRLSQQQCKSHHMGGNVLAMQKQPECLSYPTLSFRQ